MLRREQTGGRPGGFPGASVVKNPPTDGMGGRQEGGSHVNPWLIHANAWQKPLQYCKVISLQLIKINGKKRNPPAMQET